MDLDEIGDVIETIQRHFADRLSTWETARRAARDGAAFVTATN